MKTLSTLFILTLLLAACADKPRIIIDRKGVDMTHYDQDLAECRSYADEVPVGKESVKGGVAGAVVGGAIGAIVGNSRTAERAAGAGAVAGTVRGATRSEREQQQVVKRCLTGRGYRVLN